MTDERSNEVTESCACARSARLAATVAGVALLAAATGCSSSGGAAGAPKGIQIPARIASLEKSADQSTAKFVLSTMKGPMRKKVHAVTYQDGSDSSRKVFVYGGTGLPVPPGSPSSQLKRMVRTGTTNGVHVGKLDSVDPGSVGGMAECAVVRATKVVNCGWLSGETALVMSFNGFDKGSAQSLVPQILTAMVRT
jgi:hypothetical protein